MSDNPERTALYRIWGEADLLLYIGVSKDFGTRWKRHAKAQPWWPEMRRLTADEWFDSRKDAEDAEAAAIKAERPKYNKRHAVRPVPEVRSQAQPRKAPPVARTPRPSEILAANMPAMVDRAMKIGPRHPYLVSPLEWRLRDPAFRESVIAQVPEERREFARLYLGAWTWNDDLCHRLAPRLLAELDFFEQQECMARFIPQIQKLRTRIRAIAFGVGCGCCNGEPPAGMTCGECGLSGPSFRQRSAPRSAA